MNLFLNYKINKKTEFIIKQTLETKNNMESKNKIKEALAQSTPQQGNNQVTPGASADESCCGDSIPDQNISDLLRILEDLNTKKPLGNSTNLSEALHIQYEYEEELLEYIDKKSNLDPLKKKTLREFTYDILIQLMNKHTSFNICNVKASIRGCFDDLLNKVYKDRASLKGHFEFLSDLTLKESERMSAIESQINVLHENFYLEFYEECYERLQANIIPNYLLIGYAEKMNAFLLDNVSKVCLDGYYEKFKAEQPEVKQMNFFLKNLLKRNMALFDQRPNSYFDRVTMETLFKILVISNLDYLNKDVIAGQVFVSKMKKYAIIMNLKIVDVKSFYEFYKKIFIELINNKSNNNIINSKNNNLSIDNNKNKKNNSNSKNNKCNENEDQKILINNINENQLVEFSFDHELQSLFAELRKSLRSPEIYYMIIFSFSLMLNNFVLVDFDEVVLNPFISVNARERQFLLNLLKTFNNYIDDSKLQYINHKSFPYYLNSIVESFISKKLIKDEKIQIFGFDCNNKKIEIDHKIIIDSILGRDENSLSNVNNNSSSDNDNKIYNNNNQDVDIGINGKKISEIRNINYGDDEKFCIEMENLNSDYNTEPEYNQASTTRRTVLSHNCELNNVATALLSHEKNVNSFYENQNLATCNFDQNTININNNNNNTNIQNELISAKKHEAYNNDKNNYLNESQISIEINCNSIGPDINEALNNRILEKYTKLKPQLQEASSLQKVFSVLNQILNLGFGTNESVADTKLQLEKLKIRPLNNYIFSLNTSIFFSGFLSEGMDHYYAWKFFKFSLDENKEMHSFEWPALSYYEAGSQLAQLFVKAGRIYLSFRSNNFASLFEELKNIKSLQDSNIFLKAVKTAKLSGKILALAVAKRKIFRGHSINLIGFSLGCQVIKSFLKELFDLAQCVKTEQLNQDLISIVQNVVFMGGAVDFKKSKKWGQIFSTLVAGKVVNIYSEKDFVLQRLYKAAKPLNEPIGIRKLEILSCGKIDNYDLTDKNIGHLDYRSMLDHIMTEVDLDL